MPKKLKERIAGKPFASLYDGDAELFADYLVRRHLGRLDLDMDRAERVAADAQPARIRVTSTFPGQLKISDENGGIIGVSNYRHPTSVGHMYITEGYKYNTQSAGQALYNAISTKLGRARAFIALEKKASEERAAREKRAAEERAAREGAARKKFNEFLSEPLVRRHPDYFGLDYLEDQRRKGVSYSSLVEDKRFKTGLVVLPMQKKAQAAIDKVFDEAKKYNIATESLGSTRPYDYTKSEAFQRLQKKISLRAEGNNVFVPRERAKELTVESSPAELINTVQTLKTQLKKRLKSRSSEAQATPSRDPFYGILQRRDI